MLIYGLVDLQTRLDRLTRDYFSHISPTRAYGDRYMQTRLIEKTKRFFVEKNNTAYLSTLYIKL